MKKNVFFLAMMLFASVFFLTGCNHDDLGVEPALQNQSSVPGDQLSKEQALKETLPVVQEFLNAQYDYVTEKDKTPRWNKYYVQTGSDLLKQQIDDYKNYALSDVGGTFPVYSSELFFDEKGKDPWGIYEKSTIHYADGIWTLSGLVEHYSLTEYVPGALSEGADGVLTPSPFLKTSGGWIHTLQLKKEGSEWEILKWIPSGMGDSPRWYYPKEKASNTVNYEIISNNKFTSKATATTYNRTNAVNYAIAHWNNPDSRYPDYSVAPYNGDCTNFVSQCLEAGGWTQTSKVNGRASVLSWYHDQGYTSAPSVEKRSTSWTEAKSLNAFFMNSSRVVQASYLPTSLALGDIIQLKNNTSGIHHSMIVTSKPIINNVQHVRVTFRNGGGYQPKTDYDIDNFTDTKLTIKIANSYGEIA